MERFTPEDVNEIQEKVEVAMALAYRDVQDFAISRRIAAGLDGEEYIAQTEQQEIDTFNQRFTMYIMYMRGDTVTAEDKIQATNELEAAKKAAMVRELLGAAKKDDEYYARLFGEKYAIAEKMADEIGVPVSHIFADDETYYDIYRRWQSPDAYAQEAAEVVSHINGDVMLAAYARQIERFNPPEKIVEMTPDEIEDVSLRIQMDENAQKAFNESAERQAEVMRQTTVYQFLRIYGMNALLMLDDDLRDQIAPKQPWVPHVFADVLEDD